MTAAAPPRVDRSTLRLSEVARHVVIPEGIVDSLWFDVSQRCEEFGVTFDAWQDGLGQVTLGLRADGMFAATVGGVTFSIPRQVAKTFMVMCIVIALCSLYPNLTVLWTAHRMRTSTNTFQKMKGFALRAGIRGYLRAGANNGTAIRDANGEQEIPFANGSRILFGAREQGFGRGFDEVDVEVFDEAQILTDKALEDMVAATNQSRFEHGALLFYMGTPPRPTDPGDVFKARRADALATKAAAGGADFGAPTQHGDSLYVECSADPDGDPDDVRQVERANPSYPHRTPPVAVKRLRKNLPDSDSWRREGLGIWDVFEATQSAVDAGTWARLADPAAARPEGVEVSFGIDVAEDRSAWLAVAWVREDGARQVQLVEPDPRPAHSLVDRCVELAEKWDGAFVPPRAFEADLEREGLRITKLVGADFPGACGDVVDAVADGSLRHGNQAALNDAVRASRWRTSRTTNERSFQMQGCPEVGPLVAVTRALHGLTSISEGVVIW